MIPTNNNRSRQEEQGQHAQGIHVVHCIEENCSRLANDFQCFRQIRDGLERGASLQVMPLTGGLTNYSYKVCMEHNSNQQEDDDIVLFAKLCFPFALWNPNATSNYDVQRTKNEFEMMKTFAQVAPGCVPTPYLCEPVDDKMVLVTEWCDNDEQLARQVVMDGTLDPRICSKLARSMAKLHCMEFDPNFNTGIRKTMLSTFDTLQNKLIAMLDDTADDSRAAKLVHELGRQRCKDLVDTIQYHYENTRDCLVHSDLHVKNILVEQTTTNNGSFGPTGAFSVVDWEMAFAGPIGRDLGTFFPFPLCCALAHALQGNQNATIDLFSKLGFIWEEYASGLREGGKDEAFINYAFRSAIGWCGRFMFLGFYTSGTHMEDFPIDNSADKQLLLDSIGVLGLKFMLWSFDATESQRLSATELYEQFRYTIWDEVVFLIATKTQRSAICSTPMTELVVEYLLRDMALDGVKTLLVSTGTSRRLALNYLAR